MINTKIWPTKQHTERVTCSRTVINTSLGNHRYTGNTAVSAMIKPLGEYVHCASVWCQDLALPCTHATHSVFNGRGNASVEVREVRKLREEKVKAMMEEGNSEREIMRERLTLRKERKTNVLWEKEVKTYFESLSVYVFADCIRKPLFHM